MRYPAQGVVGALLLMMAAAPLPAQQLSTELQVGRIRSSLDPAAEPSQSLAAGLRYDDPSMQLRLMAGAPTSSDQPLWGAVAGMKRLGFGKRGLTAGFDMGALGFATHDRTERTQALPGPFGSSTPPAPRNAGYAFAVQLLPVVAYASGSLQMHVRAGASHYHSRFGEQELQRDARLADVQLSYSPLPSIAVLSGVKRVLVHDSTYDYASLTGLLGAGRGTIWASVGKWTGDYDGSMAWSAGAVLRIHERVSLTASTQQNAFDAQYPSAPQTAWNAGFVFKLTAPRMAAAPIPARYMNGRATIRLPLAQSRTQPLIAGDFNGWQPQHMQLSDGAWSYSVAVAPGVYNYAFVNDRGEWFVPEKHAGRKEDGMGGYVAVLVVQP